MVLSMVMITVMGMVLATVMVLTRKILAIIVLMVVNTSIISKGDAHDCLFTRTDYTEKKNVKTLMRIKRVTLKAI